MKYDEMTVSTLPMSVPNWLQADLPRRIEMPTGALVPQMAAPPPKLGPR